jgi:hypothetical protein
VSLAEPTQAVTRFVDQNIKQSHGNVAIDLGDPKLTYDPAQQGTDRARYMLRTGSSNRYSTYGK